MSSEEAAGRVRRVVTGVNEHGRSYIVSDGLAPNTFQSPDVEGFGSSVAWHAPAGPVSNDGDHDTAARRHHHPDGPEPRRGHLPHR